MTFKPLSNCQLEAKQIFYFLYNPRLFQGVPHADSPEK
jgi:hypothetical protein